MKLKMGRPVLPVIDDSAQDISDSSQSWSGTCSANHWNLYKPSHENGVDFYGVEEQPNHIHPYEPLGNGLADRFSCVGEYTGWVLFAFRTEAESQHATWLLRLNYHLNYGWLTGVPISELLTHIKASA